MMDRAATVVWWIGALCIASGIVAGVTSSSLSDMGMTVLFGFIGGAVAFSVAYILSGAFLRPPTGPLSKT